MVYPRIYWLFLLALATVPFTGCAKPATDSFEAISGALQVSCGNSLMYGTWNSIDDPARADILRFAPDCTGTSTYCASQFSFSADVGNQQFTLYVTSTNGNPTCPAVGAHTCTFTASTVVNVPAGPMTASSSEVNCGSDRIYARIGPP